jgi:predicted nucleic acid-binding protein
MTNSSGLKIVVPHIYLDTNVITAFIQKEKKWYPKIKQLLEYIKKKKWFCSTSFFCIMEVLDNLKDNEFARQKLIKEKMTWKDFRSSRNQRNLEDAQIQKLFTKFKKEITGRLLIDITPFRLQNKGWEFALKISSESNIFAPDSIHLATSLENGSDLLVSKDNFFVKVCDDKYIDSCVPDLEEIKKKLKKQNKGFKI